MGVKKERLDVVLVNNGYAPSRERAKTLIMTGNVFVNGQREDKVGTKIDIEASIEVKGNPIPFVSRGGLKLDKAVKIFGIHLQDLVCMDVGASTGGFTDCMLQNGANKVYAVDVGYGQLDWRLRQDERVICMEKTNIRYVTDKEITELLDFVSIDVSFISLKKILLPIWHLMKIDAECMCLIKPQFEAGREKVGKKGVVREWQTHFDVIKDVIEYATSISFEMLNLDFSPIKGPEGNIEYLLYMKKVIEVNNEGNGLEVIKNVVDNAHEKL
ncbi:MAG: TlyA family rRNA (cytidine-2'-O)-methyltransferase [Firmicutes bacterium HGW-Firmicutes-1]|jgi:23S rRNA (cytidine1920-2'-O)/16S rRNA (cytidine1409-2'-O)-methyltransferase|nr:MAG: TlyA family rRNA (cytidine-2'-O)-methyltransferase [Firmicutes bacterium HGW-Firmicutes-1]